MSVHLLINTDASGHDRVLAGSVEALWLAGSAETRAGILRAMRSRPDRPKLYVFLDAPDMVEGAGLDMLMAEAPDGVVLKDARCGADLQHLGTRLAVREAEFGLQDGATRIIAVITAPAAILHLASFRNASPRLAAIAFSARDFATALGVSDLESAPVASARSMSLIAAKAAGVSALTVVAAAASRDAAKRDGFDGIVLDDPAAAEGFTR